MDTICDHLVLDHKYCDDLFEQVESSIAERNWKDAHVRFRLFHDALKQHIRMEEKVLFPAFEQNICDENGPIDVLRQEHAQLRCVVDRMTESLTNFDPVDFLLHAETYTLLMQQHCVKEEVLVYPLLDKAVAERREKIIHAMTECLHAKVPSISE